ncbi:MULTISPECIES: family 16 glycosylhydrolase [unclassified Flavobacterium]|uniref:family 16 glycosylhydrolase n=1 Tax=unclassified Flavobacterium TaxID=196869 RepID=UPI001F12B36B|nr:MULTISPECIES: family 16 glycosylhydrolase [unclassified Flavobacterium]UMY65257.1 family 16 glycosylhydrolase [Flavobacterium sp. HJ-32-4]
MKRFILFCIPFLSLLQACGSGGDDDGGGGGGTAPSNLQVTVTIQGKDDTHPNGDGSGIVNFTATADNANNYLFTFPDGTSQTAANGQVQKTFTTPGVNTYSVTVAALGVNSSTSKTVSVTVLNQFDNDFSTLIWSDEFDTPGAPNTANWNYNIGNNNGWGNNELQYYTNSQNNAVVADGMLHINLIKEPTSGFAYSSARLVSENKFDFTYGKIEFRAKLPTGGGTWPALWMLGANYTSAAWPACGEIDVMEHIGNNQGTIYGTLHYPGHSGANGDGGTTSLPTASSAFHVYAVEWSPTSIKWFIDGTMFRSATNSQDKPFNHDFFIIMNVAMGGNFGGTPDAAFVQSSMDIDYVRVYQ